MRDDLFQDGIQAIVAYPSASRCHQPEYHASDRCVDSGGVHGEPNDSAHQEVDRKAAEAEVRHRAHDSYAKTCQSERGPCDVVTVAEGYDENGAYVVDDGQRQHEDAQALRNARPQQRQAANDERSIGGHYCAPALLAGWPACIIT
jgi:hypothetical protein